MIDLQLAHLANAAIPRALDSHCLDRDRSAPSARVQAIEALRIGSGPGVRFAVHLQGCPLRCGECRERDGRQESEGLLLEGGRTITVDSLVADLGRYTAYMALSGGGVTVCGGEPLAQSRMVAALFRRCHDLGIPTALDTTGEGNLFSAHGVLHVTDLVVLDVTGFDRETVSMRPMPARVRFARHVAEIGKPIWLRLTAIPGVTDCPDRLAALAEFALTLPTLAKIEVVTTDRLGGTGILKDCPVAAIAQAPTATGSQLRAIRTAFRRFGLRAE